MWTALAVFWTASGYAAEGEVAAMCSSPKSRTRKGKGVLNA